MAADQVHAAGGQVAGGGDALAAGQLGQVGEGGDLLGAHVELGVVKGLDKGDDAVGDHAERPQDQDHLALRVHAAHVPAQGPDPRLERVVETGQGARDGGQGLAGLHPGDEGVDPLRLLGQQAALGRDGVPHGPQVAQHHLTVRPGAGPLRADGGVGGQDLGDLAQRQAAVGQPPDTQQARQVPDAVLAPAAHGGRYLQQAQAVVVPDRPGRGPGQVGDLGDAHGPIPPGDATSPSSGGGRARAPGVERTGGADYSGTRHETPRPGGKAHS